MLSVSGDDKKIVRIRSQHFSTLIGVIFFNLRLQQLEIATHGLTLNNMHSG